MKHIGIPAFDVAALGGGSMRAQAGVVLDIGAAARDIGFFTVVNHGVPAPLRDRALRAAQRFFELPAAVRERLGAERPALGDSPESLRIGHDIAGDDSSAVARTAYPGLSQWPGVPDLRETAMTYFRAMNKLAAQIARAFALDLGMPPNFFESFSDRPLTTLRMLHYPPGSGQGDAARDDWGLFTLLAQDDGGGLEVQRRDGQWVGIDPVADAFVCGVGNCLMRWSNDRYVSRPYRVVNRGARAQHAIAFSSDPNPDTVIACLPTCLDEDESEKYPPIAYSDYARERFAGAAVPTAV